MALIDFECEKCGEKFFEIINSNDAGKVKCPECGSPVKRVYKGKFYGNGSSGGGNCSGSCRCCSGCH